MIGGFGADISDFLEFVTREDTLGKRSSHWWDHVVKSTFTHKDWLENFRVLQSMFACLCDEVQSSIKKNDTAMRKAIPTNMRVALILWFLATGADYCTIGHLFGVSKPDICMVLRNVCSAIVKLLLPQYISFLQELLYGRLLTGLKMNMASPSVLELWMDDTSLSSHRRNVQLTIITVKVGTPSFYKEPLTIKGISWRSM